MTQAEPCHASAMPAVPFGCNCPSAAGCSQPSRPVNTSSHLCAIVGRAAALWCPTGRSTTTFRGHQRASTLRIVASIACHTSPNAKQWARSCEPRRCVAIHARQRLRGPPATTRIDFSRNLPIGAAKRGTVNLSRCSQADSGGGPGSVADAAAGLQRLCCLGAGHDARCGSACWVASQLPS